MTMTMMMMMTMTMTMKSELHLGFQDEKDGDWAWHCEIGVRNLFQSEIFWVGQRHDGDFSFNLKPGRI